MVGASALRPPKRMAYWRRVPTHWLLFLFFFSIYALTMSGSLQYGGEMEKYRVAQSIVDRQSLAIRPIATRAETGIGGQTYSIYEMGQTLLEIPLYALGRLLYHFFPTPDINWITLLTVGLLNPILTALTCVLLYEMGIQLGFSAWTSLGVTFLFGLGTIAWPYSRGFDREPLLGLLILCSFYTAFRFRQTMESRWLVITGLVSGFLVFTKFIQVMVLPLLLIYFAAVIYQDRRQAGCARGRSLIAVARGWFLCLLPLLGFMVFQVFYAIARFGTFFGGIGGSKLNLVEVILNEIRLSQPVAAVVGLIFSNDRSLFIYSPPAILFLATWFRWFRTRRPEALLLLGIILIEFASTATRFEWWGGPRWGARYLVQIVPLMMVPVGVLESLPRRARTLWIGIAAGLFSAGLLVQGVGVLTNERDYMDAVGRDPNLAGQLDFLLHGALDSLVLNLSPIGSTLQLNPFGLVLVLTAVLLLITVRDQARSNDDGGRAAMAGSTYGVVLLIEFAAFVIWVVAPYAQVLTAKGNTRFYAGDRFLAEGRTSEASAMYLQALERGTTFQSEAVTHWEELNRRARGDEISADDLMNDIQKPAGAIVEKDTRIKVSGTEALKISIPGQENQDVSATTGEIAVDPDTDYELSGWIRTERAYGAGYSVITLYEDNGAWRKPRKMDVVTLDETSGWRPFRKAFTTLPSTRRIFVAAGLWDTFGTVWVDDLELAQIAQ